MTDKQKWAIVAAAKHWFDAEALKDLRLRWARLNFYNLPTMSKDEASSILQMLNEWNPDPAKLRGFFEQWKANAADQLADRP